MPARRKVSDRQLEVLVEFAENHREIALGRLPGGPQAARIARSMWETIAGQLNSVAEGRTKTPDQWRRYWIELKAKTKAKAADSRRNSTGPNRLLALSAQEERVLEIIGPVAVDGSSGTSSETTEYGNSNIDTLNDQVTCIAVLTEEEPNEEWSHNTKPQHQTVSQTSSPAQSVVLGPQRQRRTAQKLDQPQLQNSNRPATRSRRRWRPIKRVTRVPRWALDIESRRIAAEERHAAAMEALVDVIKGIRQDLNSYFSRLS